MHITDPVASPPPDPAAFGFTAALSNLTIRFGAVNPGASFTETRNGTEGLVFAPTGLQQAHHMNIVRQDSSGTTVVTEHLQAAFAPAQGSLLVPGQALPNGELVATGESSWQHGGSAAEMEIATAVPLAYDASCATGSPTPFRAGEVHARAASPDGQAVVRIVFANCQAPAITLVAHNCAYGRRRRAQSLEATCFAICVSIASCFAESGTPYTRTMKVALPFLTYNVVKAPAAMSIASSPTPLTGTLVRPGI